MSGEQQDGAAEAVQRFADAWRDPHAYVHEARNGTLLIARDDHRTVRLTEPQLRAVLAERDALAKRVAHLDSARDSAVREWRREHDAADALQAERDALAARVAELEAEREADTRVVAELRTAYSQGGRGWAETDALIARFADRIAALAETSGI